MIGLKKQRQLTKKKELNFFWEWPPGTCMYSFFVIVWKANQTISSRLLRWPCGRMPSFPYLQRRWHRRTIKILLFVSQRHHFQPGLLHLRLVVQRRLLRGRGSSWVAKRWPLGRLWRIWGWSRGRGLYRIRVPCGWGQSCWRILWCPRRSSSSHLWCRFCRISHRRLHLRLLKSINHFLITHFNMTADRALL